MGSEQLPDANQLDSIRSVIVGGVRILCATRRQLIAMMVRDCLAARKAPMAVARLIFDVNGQGLSLRATNPAYRTCMENADVIHADGYSVVAASRFMTDCPIPERSVTTDLIRDAASAASDHSLSFFLLGGKESTNAECAARLRILYPQLRIAGHHHGYFLLQDESAICDMVNQSRADVVWVGLGKPREQEFCLRNRARLNTGWLITCGGCFQYITGEYVRAPRWMQESGLEWMHRMVTEPRHLFWRYLTTTPHAAYLILTRTRRQSTE